MSDFSQFIFRNILPDNNQIAIIDSNLKTYTYGDLHNEIQRIKQLLKKNDLFAGDQLLLKTEKSFTGLAFLLSCIETGIIYIPVDVNSPSSRLNKIIESSKSKAIVNEDFTISQLPHSYKYSHPNALCLLYTSGSTGVPKGVVISQSGVLAFINWAIKEFKITSDDRITSYAPFYFDLSTFDIFASLATGASIWLIDQKTGANFRLLGENIQNIQPTIWYATPTTFSLLNQYGKLDLEYCPRLVLYAGEIFPMKNLNGLRKRWKKAHYYNLYGPTETNVCTYFKLPVNIEENRKTPYPIGKDCPYIKTKIMGNELWVSGESLMIEYINAPDETKEKLVADDHLLWYKTGDLVKKENNQLIYVGRIDRMIKRRGYRIELNEIEKVLQQHPEIIQVAVSDYNDNETLKIAAFYTGKRLSMPEISIYCSKNLLNYMIPDRYIHLNSIPTNQNGKIDYIQLIANFNPHE